eukprot:7273650-Pyramimonas_sp.AAC.1
MPTSCKLEPRPRHPVVFSQWVRQAENAIAVFGLVYGRMHEPERRRSLETLRLATRRTTWPSPRTTRAASGRSSPRPGASSFGRSGG